MFYRNTKCHRTTAGFTPTPKVKPSKMAAIALGGRGVHLLRSVSLLLFVFVGLPHTDGTCTNTLDTGQPIVHTRYGGTHCPNDLHND